MIRVQKSPHTVLVPMGVDASAFSVEIKGFLDVFF